MKMDENIDNLIYGNIFISCTHTIYTHFETSEQCHNNINDLYI